MKVCKHRMQEVTETAKGIKAQSCVKCGELMAKWNARSGKYLFVRSDKKQPLSAIDNQAFSEAQN